MAAEKWFFFMMVLVQLVFSDFSAKCFVEFNYR